MQLQLTALSMAAAVSVIWGATAAHAEPWRAGWANLSTSERTLAAAKELKFNAIVTQGKPEQMEAFAKQAGESGIEVYFWTSTIAGKGDEPLAQEMSAAEKEILATQKADTDPKKHGNQFGFDPQEGRREVLDATLLCLDKPAAVDAFKQRIRTMMDACPTLAGVAFDYIGYQNYHCCYCTDTEKLFTEWRKTHADMPEDKARDQFSLERLTAHYNMMADYVRTLRPGLKVTAHIYPVFLPEPVYGSRLNLDTVQETAAWYFEPYWPEDKVKQRARAIVGKDAKPQKGARGIPFVALYVKRPVADKPVERFVQELDWIFTVTGDTSISIYDFRMVALHDEYRGALKAALTKHGGL